MEITFKSLKELVDLIPKLENGYFKGSEEIIEKYSEFLDKIVKYAIDEKDIDMRENFF